MTNQKQIQNNAAISYLLICISWVLLFNKENPSIHNAFVRKHIFSSTVLHYAAIINYIIFISFGFLDSINILGYGLHIIAANVGFLILGVLAATGIYNAINGKSFSVVQALNQEKKNILEVQTERNFNEKDKLSLLIAYIPFLGYIHSSKYKKNPEIQSILQLNISITLFLYFVFALGYHSLASLLILLYIVFIAFAGINLFGNSSFFAIKFHNFFQAQYQLFIFHCVYIYLKRYFTGTFTSFQHIQEEVKEKYKQQQEQLKAEISTLPEYQGPKILLYFPIINFFLSFQTKHNYILHLRNGIMIGILMVIIVIGNIFGLLPSHLLIPCCMFLCFGIGHLFTKYYKMPYIYKLYQSFGIGKKQIIATKKQVQEIQNTVKEASYKVEDKKSTHE